MNRLPIHFHAGDDLLGFGVSVGSPLYDTPAAHLPALLILLLLPVLSMSIRVLARRSVVLARLRDGYLARPPLHRLAAWLLGASALIHLALIGHHEGVLAVLMIADGLVLGLAALRLLHGRRWRPLAALALTGSLVGWMVVTVTGRVPDQVALLTKLIELAALAIVLTPVRGGRFRGAAATAAIVVTGVLINVVAWVGAFGGGSADHHVGATPQPGTLLPVGYDRPPTPREQSVADSVWRATAVTLRHFEDPAVAERAGYAVGEVQGLDHHASHPRYVDDGRTLDPTRPENLIYAESPAGPVLLGAMFEMPWGGVGPVVGGPLTVWHGHEQICFSVTGMTGLVSPFGGCPLGSAIVARTGEMLHVWTAPGAPTRWGELDDAWKLAYVAAVAEARLAASATR